MTVNAAITIRPATDDDVPLIAHNVLDAVGIEHPETEALDHLAELCRCTDVLYSWANTDIALWDGRPVGSLTSYDGGRYAEMRVKTFAELEKFLGMDFSRMSVETGPGEFYLDSLAVLPGFRGKGIGTLLMQHGIAKARALRFPRAALLVDIDNPDTMRLYESLGFKKVGEMYLFSTLYARMIVELPPERR
ncbi:MAG: GNAT family N-acetyltransferase [Bacteroidales bacterium]|nr:GNAT family N-acetyltransferase [Bacteroidales bacterium]